MKVNKEQRSTELREEQSEQRAGHKNLQNEDVSNDKDEDAKMQYNDEDEDGKVQLDPFILTRLSTLVTKQIIRDYHTSLLYLC